MSIAFHPRVWMNWLISPTTSLERRILELVLSAADKNYQLLLKTQISEVNFVQRHAGGRDVHLYHIEKGLWPGRQSKPLDVQSKEFCWTKLVIIDTHSKRSVNVEIWILNGRVANLVFSANPAQFNVPDCQFKIVHMVSFGQNIPVVDDEMGLLPSDLKQAAERFANDTGAISFVFPEDTYEIDLPQGKFVVIGEVADFGVLMVSTADETLRGKVYLGPYDGSDPKLLGKDCAEAVVKFQN